MNRFNTSETRQITYRFRDGSSIVFERITTRQWVIAYSKDGENHRNVCIVPIDIQPSEDIARVVMAMVEE